MKNFLLNNKWFLISIVVGAIAAFILCYIPFWYLVIIAGILAGLFNRTMKKGIISGLTGVTIGWLIYIIIGIVINNTYLLLDQFGALIIGDGFGWLMLLLILLIGALFGALGGAIGSGIMILIKGYEKSPRE